MLTDFSQLEAASRVWAVSPCGLLYPSQRHSENLGILVVWGFFEIPDPKAVSSRYNKSVRLGSWC